MARSRSGSTQRPRLDRGPGGFARAALIAAAILLPVLGPGRAGAQEPHPRAIAVTGEGSIRARPEIARLRPARGRGFPGTGSAPSADPPGYD